jgi:hypothetical protein
VPCPGLLPTLAPGVAPPRLCEGPPTCQRGQWLRFQWDGFQVPPGYLGPSDYGTLDIDAGPTHGAAGRLPLRCRNARRIATPTVHQTRAVLATCPEAGQQSSWGGTMLLRWSQQGTLVVVTVYGWSDVNQRLVVAVANQLRLVRPST